MDYYQSAFDDISTWIVTNGNNEITAAVLNPILDKMVQAGKDTTGLLDDLATNDQSNLVAAINELKGILDTVNTTQGVQIYFGEEDPSVAPPDTYKAADFYMQTDSENNAVQLWQYNGFNWVQVSFSGAVTGVQTISAGTGISVDNTDPQNPIISTSASGNFIPITGTTPTEPVTGVVQSESLWEIVNGGTSLGYLGNDGGIGSLKLTNGAEKYVRLDNDHIEFYRDPIGSMLFSPDYDQYGFRVTVPGDEFAINKRGLIGNEDYTANVQDLDFVQKKYVDDLFDGGGTTQGLEANRLVDNSMEGDVTNTGKYVAENASGKTEVASYGITSESEFGTGYYLSNSFSATSLDYDATFCGFQEGYFTHAKETTSNQKGVSIGLQNFPNGDPTKTVFAAWPNPELEPGQVPTFAVSASVNGGAKVFATGDGNINITVPIGGVTNVTGVAGETTVANDGSGGKVIGLANAGTAGTYGSASNVPVTTTDSKGRVTSVSNTPIQIAQSQVTNLTTDLSAKANDNAVVHNTGNESIAGVKTFASPPIVPTATTSGQAVNKGQLDTALSAKQDLLVNSAGLNAALTDGTGWATGAQVVFNSAPVINGLITTSGMQSASGSSSGVINMGTGSAATRIQSSTNGRTVAAFRQIAASGDITEWQTGTGTVVARTLYTGQFQIQPGTASDHAVTLGQIQTAGQDAQLNVSAARTITLADFGNSANLTIFATAASSATIITLPDAATLGGRTINIIKTDATANAVQAKGNGSQLINASNTYNLTGQYQTARIKSNGTQNYLF